MSKFIVIISILFLLVSCGPYKTFFKETHNTQSVHFKNKKTYRLKIKGINEFQTIDNSKLKNIRSLNISGINSEGINYILKTFPYPENLKVLHMDSLNIETLPKSIHRFKNVKQISLNNNPQLNLKESTEILTALPIEFLSLQGNKLTALPENIISLKSLKDLNLSNNSINNEATFLNLNKLPKLSSLWLTNNKLNQLPSTISALSHLKYLYIEKNNLTQLPNNMEQLKKVWVIHAGHNNFESLPAVFAKIPKLLLLHINNCNITEIPEVFASKSSNIKGIILDNNMLSESDKKRWQKEFKSFFLLSIN